MMATINDSRSVIIGLVLCWSLVAAGQQFGGGRGAADDPYRIATAEQLLSIGADPNLLDKHFLLIADIDLSNYRFEQAPIAPNTDPCAPFFEGDPFTGVLAGNGHVIRHLHVEGGPFLGLFGSLAPSAVVSGLGLEDCLILGQYNVGALTGAQEGTVSGCYSTGVILGDFYVGGLIGEIYEAGRLSGSFSTAAVTGIGGDAGGLVGGNVGGSIWNCHSSGQTNGGPARAGGLVGFNRQGIVGHCYSTGPVLGDRYVGGLVGTNDGGTVSGCYSTGAVTGFSLSMVLGGLVGQDYGGNVSDCFSTGAVTGYSEVGGLIGAASGGCVSNCYSTGAVSGHVWIGGLIGAHHPWGANGFWNVETSGLATSNGGTGLTTAEMQTMETYLEAGWDFVGESANGTAETWEMPPEGDYPRLSALAGYEPVLPQGQGTLADPFLITNAEELGSMGHRPFASYRLDVDLDLSDVTWSVAPIPAFAGNFDGNGRRIHDLQIHGAGFLGLFGYLGTDAVVSDLGLESVSVQGSGSAVGSLAGRSRGKLTTSYGTGTVSGGAFTGGLVGYQSGSVADCYGSGKVRGGRIPRGLLGRNEGRVATCFWSGEDKRELWYADGVVEDVTIAEMQDIETYLNAGWDFVGETENGTADLWTICSGQDYPHLSWEGIVCAE
ncbi:MAG: hypothetical protein JSW27_06540 [Phycisphaerales bacterium]|nr:MAG: hypothetical protein JSW27_06540 [Phycisphaerales bacterium]